VSRFAAPAEMAKLPETVAFLILPGRKRGSATVT
jgi:hypothetical protein